MQRQRLRRIAPMSCQRPQQLRGTHSPRFPVLSGLVSPIRKVAPQQILNRPTNTGTRGAPPSSTRSPRLTVPAWERVQKTKKEWEPYLVFARISVVDGASQRLERSTRDPNESCGRLLLAVTVQRPDHRNASSRCRHPHGVGRAMSRSESPENTQNDSCQRLFATIVSRQSDGD